MDRKKYLGYIVGGVLLIFAVFIGVTYNSLVKKDEKVKLQWNEVQNSYQRRLDLIPNLVNTVKGNAGFETAVLQQITEARAKANYVNVSSTDVSATGYQAQKAAQDELAASANRLFIQIEKYPDLQGTKAFTTLQTQLERTELRIKTARKDFNEAIQDYNTSARNFPTSIVGSIFGFKAKNGFQSDAGAETATEIKF